MKNPSFFLIFLFFLVLAHNTAGASCGAATCPLNMYHPLSAGWFSLNWSYERINQDQLFIGSLQSFVGAIPEPHDEIQTINERNVLLAGYGIADQLALQVSVPFIHREHSHIDHDNGGSSYQSWNFSGLGDAIVTGQFTLLSPSEEFAPYLGVSAGIKLSTGVTDFRNADGDLAEVTIQPGTGSVDEVFGLHYRQTVLSVPIFSGQYSALPLIFGVLYQRSGKGTDDYRFGNALQVHVGTEYQFVSRASVLFQVNGKFQDYADVGTTGEPRGNTGGTWIYASPGVSFQVLEEVSAYGYVQVPVYQNVHGLQQTAKFNLQFGLSYTTNLLGNG